MVRGTCEGNVCKRKRKHRQSVRQELCYELINFIERHQSATCPASRNFATDSGNDMNMYLGYLWVSQMARNQRASARSMIMQTEGCLFLSVNVVNHSSGALSYYQ